MKKNRNSFFTEANMSYSGFAPNTYFSNPNMNMPMNQYNDTNTIDSRLAKIERQINRLEHRVSKLESANTTYITEDIDSSGNMYML